MEKVITAPSIYKKYWSLAIQNVTWDLKPPWTSYIYVEIFQNFKISWQIRNTTIWRIRALYVFVVVEKLAVLWGVLMPSFLAR